MKRYIRKNSSENLFRSGEIRLRSAEIKETEKSKEDQILKIYRAA